MAVRSRTAKDMDFLASSVSNATTKEKTAGGTPTSSPIQKKKKTKKKRLLPSTGG